MPIGDNQHVFTCPRCAIQQPRSDQCKTSLECVTCCRPARRCLRNCPCGAVLQTCSIDPLKIYCSSCGKHKSCPRTAYRCKCFKCVSCGASRSADYLVQGNPEHACSDCHSSNRVACRHCLVPGCEGVPEACCGHCEVHCSAHGCGGVVDPGRFAMAMEDGGQKPKIWHSRPGQFQFNPVKRTIGLEVEIERFRNGVGVGQFVKSIGGAIVSDGSVASGFEINTPPMNGDAYVHMTQGLSLALIKARAKTGTAASMHTHIGCLDLSYDDIRRAVILYGRLESGLYSIIDPRRFTGQYSRPNGGRMLANCLQDPGNAKEAIIRMVFKKPAGKSFRRDCEGKHPSGGQRYWGMNLYSWFHRGTIEFRMHHGTIQWEKMAGWGMLLASMVDCSTRYSEKSIQEWPQGLKGLLKASPTPWVQEWVKTRWDKFAAKRNNKLGPIADF